MNKSSIPLTRDLVLIGGGHTHALILRKWGMRPLPGTRVTVINPDPTAPYSGMLPGFVAGHYERDQLDIDLIKLARFSGARLIIGAVDDIDTKARLIHVAGRPPIAYDIASIDIGITSAMPRLPGFSDAAVPAKPLGPFAAKWDAYRAHVTDASVAVIGGGVAGAELAMGMAHALRVLNKEGRVHLIDRGEILKEFQTDTRHMLLDALENAGVKTRANSAISAIDPQHIHFDDGTTLFADFITGAAGAMPHKWLEKTGLALQDGFVNVSPTLQSSDPAIFAVGDCAHLTMSPRPKAGVFAVRQAPILFENLRAVLSGGTPIPYKPQKDYLKLVSLGGKVAMAEKLGRARKGRLLWKWKNHIDQKFMDQFRQLPFQKPTAVARTVTDGVRDLAIDKPLCGGCGAKVGRDALTHALNTLPRFRNDIDHRAGDDSAVLRIGGQQQVITTDHLRAITDDPVLMAQIAANHALGDIWAMGAAPQAALAQIILPHMSATLQARMMDEIMATSGQVFQSAGAEIIGGHSSMGAEMTIGFSITGLCEQPLITLANARVRDVLILTKPIGSGTLLAAEMAGLAKGADIAACYDVMTQSQATASQILAHANAMTDVTGFGLAGHLDNICTASNCGAVINMDAVPVMQGALELTNSGVRSTLYRDNKHLVPELPDGAMTDLLFDPQTAGGLLAAIPEETAETTLKNLIAAGYPAVIIGRITDGSGITLI